MKPRNFPARKLRRQLNAMFEVSAFFSRAGMPFEHPELEAARAIRTKKNRSGARP